jgi:hypothetical protein
MSQRVARMRANKSKKKKTSSSKLPAVGSTAGNFLRISSQILSALFFEQKAASNLIPKRAAVRYLKKTRRLNQRH